MRSLFQKYLKRSSSLMKFLFLGLIFGVHQNVYADFELQKEYCTISNTFIGTTSENTEYDGVVNISFIKNNNIIFPFISINLSRNIKPMDMAIGWPNIKLEDSKGRPLFENSFQARMEMEKERKYSFKKEGYSFNSQAYGYYRFQHFIALFLSQSHFVIYFTDEETGKKESQTVSLAGSDMSFREMSYHCYEDKVKEYLNSDLTRTKPVHESWMMGYGITNFYLYEDFLPEEVKFPNEMAKVLNSNSEQGYKILSDLSPLLAQKAELNQKIQDFEIKEDYVSLKTTIDETTEQILQLKSNLHILGGANGEIEKINLEISQIEKDIQNAEQIIALYEKDLNPLDEKVEALKINIEKLQEQINQFEQKIELAQTQKKSYEESLDNLKRILESYVDEYNAEDLKNAETKLTTPYSIEVIEESDKKLKDQIQKRIEQNRVIALINSITVYMDKLLKDHNSALILFNEISVLKIEKVKLQNLLNTSRLNEIEFHRRVGGINFEFLIKKLNDDKKANKFNNLTNTEVKKQLENQKLESYKAFDALIDELNTDYRVILPKLLCKTEIFSELYRGQCLNALEIVDNKNIEIYLDQLDSSDLVYLGNIVTSENLTIRKYESTLMAVLQKNILDELKTNMKDQILKKWNDVLYFNWITKAVKKFVDEDNFNFDAVIDIFNIQKNSLSKILSRQEELKKQIADNEKKIQNLNSKFLDVESKYFVSLEENQKNILTELKNINLNMADLNLKCLLNITSVDVCAENVNTVKTSTISSLEDLNKEIKETVILLVLSAQKQLASLQENLTKTLSDIDNSIEAKNEFISSNQFDEKKEEFSSINGELNRQKIRLKNLIEQKANAEQRKKMISDEKKEKQMLHDSLKKEMEALVQKIQPTLNQLKPVCSEQNQNIDNLIKIEKQIFSKIGVTRNPEPVNSICQINY